jgi:hypothetical protein
MKTPAELKKLVPGLTDPDLHNYLKLRHITHAGKRGRHYVYPDHEYLVLRRAHALKSFEGIQCSKAFERARQEYDQNAGLIREFVGDFVERSNGFGPGLAAVTREFMGRFEDVGSYVTAMSEDGTLAVTNGQLTLQGTFSSTAMAAYSSQDDAAFRLLSSDQRAWLRTLATAIYRQYVSPLPVEERLPAPLKFLEAEKVSVVRRLLPLGISGYSDIDNNSIVVSVAIAPGSGRERFVLTHEYFHLRLKHEATASELENKAIEAQATYGASHFLIPRETFDRYLAIAEHSADSVKEQNQLLAKQYGVTEGLIERYRAELSSESM